MATVLPEVEAFLNATGMAPTTFGDQALGDRHFVRQLRKGRRCWPETEQKVRVFIAGFRSPKVEQAVDAPAAHWHALASNGAATLDELALAAARQSKEAA